MLIIIFVSLFFLRLFSSIFQFARRIFQLILNNLRVLVTTQRLITHFTPHRTQRIHPHRTQSVDIFLLFLLDKRKLREEME